MKDFKYKKLITIQIIHIVLVVLIFVFGFQNSKTPYEASKVVDLVVYTLLSVYLLGGYFILRNFKLVKTRMLGAKEKHFLMYLASAYIVIILFSLFHML
ncbi:MAG: hypothetical protein RL641_180 [Candidatus Parcubacteria bacterium]|jgi:hypothetical protein